MRWIFCRFGLKLHLDSAQARRCVLRLLITLAVFGVGIQAAMGAQNSAPGQPVLRSPANGGNDVARPTMLDVDVSDPNRSSVTVAFYGRAAQFTSPGPDFTMIVLPDPQYYNATLNGGTPAIFAAQTQWIADNRKARNIAFVLEVGDSVENGDNSGNPAEWLNASAAFSTVQAAGLPHGLSVGNHDQSPTSNPNGTTAFYNQYFGTTHFRDTYFYGGHFGTNSDNHFDLFTASGLNFVVVYLEYDPAANFAVLDWANQVLATYSDRRAIVVSHYIIGPGNPAVFGAQGQAIYDALKSNSNLFLMLCGHESTEGRRQDTFNGNTVASLLANYQYRTNGGNGWLRILQFSPTRNQIFVQTYSPTLNVFETDDSSQFIIPYDMRGSGANFDVIATVPNVASGSTATATWDNLTAATEYEWYVTAGNGATTTVGPRWTFTTAAEQTNHPPVATEQGVSMNEDTLRAITLSGSDPDNDVLSYAVVTGPAHGTVAGTAPNLTYSPALNYNGSDSFTFKVNDGTLDSAPALVSITINPVNDPPVAVSMTISVRLNASYTGTLTATDVDSVILSYALVTPPRRGSVVVNPDGQFTYRPRSKGGDSFTFQASDGMATSNVAKVSITVH